jgi:hypothetical protein
MTVFLWFFSVLVLVLGFWKLSRTGSVHGLSKKPDWTRLLSTKCDGQPILIPMETHTRSHGSGFLRVRGVDLLKPKGAQTHTGLGCGLQ